MPLLKNNVVVADTWIHLGAEDALPVTGDIVVLFPRLLKDKLEVLFSRPDDRGFPERMGEIDEPRLLPGKVIVPGMTGSAPRAGQEAQHNNRAE